MVFSGALLSIPSGFGSRKAHARSRCHLPRQNSMPEVVFNEPIRKKNGMQTVAIYVSQSAYICNSHED